MILTELLNTDVPVTITTNTAQDFRATFMGGGEAYRFHASAANGDSSNLQNLWLVDFAHEQYRENGSHATGTGDQFTVFAAVAKIMDMLVQKIEKSGIGGVIFEGTTLEPVRLKIYARYSKKLASRPGWRLEDSGYNGWFIVVYNQ